MQTKEWRFPESSRFRDRGNWSRGPWDSEPDKRQWPDAATGLPCLIVRGPAGALCGYVGVTQGHPWFGKGYDDVEPCPDVHGGLTFANRCSPEEKEEGVCHIVETGEDVVQRAR